MSPGAAFGTFAMQSLLYLLLGLFLIGTLIAILCDFAGLGKTRKTHTPEVPDDPEAKAKADAMRVAGQCDEARDHLRTFYEKNRELLAARFSPDELHAYIQHDMSGETEPVTLWGACKRKIEELKPLIDEGRIDQAKLLQIDEAIKECERQIAGVKKSANVIRDEDGLIDDVTQGQEQKLRGLQKDRKLLMTLKEAR